MDNLGYGHSKIRERCANYLDDESHTVAVTARANRSKGAKVPEEWMPPDEGYRCEYAFHWTDVKTMWQLKMTKAEADAVMEMLSTCPVEVNVLVVNETAQQETREPEPREEPEPTEELQDPVYGSCQEAEFAGESRFQGSQGGGLGYPKAMVPSARDGDGDGIVCER